MKETEIEKLRQLVSRTDMRGNQKVDWLVNFINEREQAFCRFNIFVLKAIMEINWWQIKNCTATNI